MALFGRKHSAGTTTAPKAVDPELAALSGEYVIDPNHSQIGFTVRHAMVTNVRGHFGEHEGSLVIDGANPAESTARIEVTTASVDTGAEQRDGHLRSADFFDAETFPKMTFVSTHAEELGGEDYRITGDLTIRGVTRPLSIDLEFLGSATDPNGNQRIGFEGRAELLRSEWGLSWNAALESGGMLVSDKVKLDFEISAIKQAEGA